MSYIKTNRGQEKCAMPINGTVRVRRRVIDDFKYENEYLRSEVRLLRAGFFTLVIIDIVVIIISFWPS